MTIGQKKVKIRKRINSKRCSGSITRYFSNSKQMREG